MPGVVTIISGGGISKGWEKDGARFRKYFDYNAEPPDSGFSRLRLGAKPLVLYISLICLSCTFSLSIYCFSLYPTLSSIHQAIWRERQKNCDLVTQRWREEDNLRASSNILIIENIIINVCYKTFHKIHFLFLSFFYNLLCHLQGGMPGWEAAPSAQTLLRSWGLLWMAHLITLFAHDFQLRLIIP